VAYHRKGLELQWEQFAKGAALSVALNRPLLLPRFVCYCDKHWAGAGKCGMPGVLEVRVGPAVWEEQQCVGGGSELGVVGWPIGRHVDPHAAPMMLRQGRALPDTALPEERASGRDVREGSAVAPEHSETAVGALLALQNAHGLREKVGEARKANQRLARHFCKESAPQSWHACRCCDWFIAAGCGNDCNSPHRSKQRLVVRV